MDETKYNEEFKDPPKIQAVAWDKAWAIRNFEIEMYWKRTTYFWAFQVAVFAGYFAMVKDNNLEAARVIYLLTNIGFLISIIWVLVNKGSKFWQENWESHIDILENEISGPLYKTVVKRGDGKSYSVSRLNNQVSWIFVLVWLGLGVEFLVKNELLNFSDGKVDWFVASSTFITGVFSLIIIFGQRTKTETLPYNPQLREYSWK